MFWINKCGRCGHNIFNGTDGREDSFDFVEEMKNKGYRVGYENEKAFICSKCSNEEIKKRNDKIVKKQVKKLIPTLKKVYICPFCKGYIDQAYTSSKKSDVVKHLIEEHYIYIKQMSD